jgi:hypothetical protein
MTASLIPQDNAFGSGPIGKHQQIKLTMKLLHFNTSKSTGNTKQENSHMSRVLIFVNNKKISDMLHGRMKILKINW